MKTTARNAKELINNALDADAAACLAHDLAVAGGCGFTDTDAAELAEVANTTWARVNRLAALKGIDTITLIWEN